MESVARKWFTRLLHPHGGRLPTAPVANDVPELPSDPGWTVMFVGFWLFAQQIYLLHYLYDEPTTRRFDELFYDCGRWRSCRRSSR